MESDSSPKKRILVADDNRDGADTLAMVLEYLGYETAVAYNGKEAVQVAHNFNPDVVILDINMPVMDGYEAARTLRRSENSQRRVLIALTAVTADEAKTKAKQAGFDVHLGKPLEGGQLAEVIESARPTAD